MDSGMRSRMIDSGIDSFVNSRTPSKDGFGDIVKDDGLGYCFQGQTMAPNKHRSTGQTLAPSGMDIAKTRQSRV